MESIHAAFQGQFPWETALESDASSTTDPDSRLFKKAKGHEAKLAYLGEVLMENRHGLVVDACVVPATGTGERDAAEPGRESAAPTRQHRRRQGVRHVRLRRHCAP